MTMFFSVSNPTSDDLRTENLASVS